MMPRETLRLHGIRVAADDYGRLRSLSGILYALTRVQTNEVQALRASTERAIAVLASWREFCANENL